MKASFLGVKPFNLSQLKFKILQSLSTQMCVRISQYKRTVYFGTKLTCIIWGVGMSAVNALRYVPCVDGMFSHCSPVNWANIVDLPEASSPTHNTENSGLGTGLPPLIERQHYSGNRNNANASKSKRNQDRKAIVNRYSVHHFNNVA